MSIENRYKCRHTYLLIHASTAIENVFYSRMYNALSDGDSNNNDKNKIGHELKQTAWQCSPPTLK